MAKGEEAVDGGRCRKSPLAARRRGRGLIRVRSAARMCATLCDGRMSRVAKCLLFEAEGFIFVSDDSRFVCRFVLLKNLAAKKLHLNVMAETALCSEPNGVSGNLV